MMLSDFLRSGILSIFLVIVAASGWLWNILIVAVMMRNRLPVGRKLQVIGALPFGLSFYFTGIGMGLAVAWWRDFCDGRYPEDTDWLERLRELP